jgi:hypothetical protein
VKGLLVSALVLGILSSCGTASTGGPAIQDLQGDFGDLPRPEQFEERLSQIVVAHRACDFSDRVRLFVPAGVNGTGSWDGVDSECLGTLRVIDWTRESESLVAIHLVAGDAVAVEADLLFVFASFDAGEWKFSWPVAAGPELHP